MDDTDLIEEAKKKVKDKKHFYSHFNAFCIVTFLLFLINYLTTPEIWWFFFPLLGWGMAVIGHYLNVFGFPSFRDRVWEEKQFQLELDKLERSQSIAFQVDEDEALGISADKLELRELRKTTEKKRNYNSEDFV